MSVARYYAWLSRFQDAARRVAHDTGQETFTVHRHLRGDDGAASGDVLHRCLVEALGATSTPTTPATLDVLDAGCGLGGTLLYLHAALGARGVGITLSPDQHARAAAEAQRRGLADICRFAVRDYDADLTDLIPSRVDLVVAIESLAHAPDPAATIARLAARLRPGGRLLIVDDAPADSLAAADPDFVAFRRGWLCPAIAHDSELTATLARAGLTLVLDTDLTPRLPRRSDAALAALWWLTGVGLWGLSRTSIGALIGALHGGLALERLYRRDLIRYRLLVAHAGVGGHTGNHR